MHTARSRRRTLTSTIATALLLALAPPGAAQTWLPGPALTYARHGLDAIEHGGDVYAIGGWNGGTRLEVLAAGAPGWTGLAQLPVKQEGVAAARVGDRIFTMGSYGPANVCQIYDITTDTWQAGPTLPLPLYWATAEAVGDKVYLIGGYSPGAPGGSSLDTLYILDTVTLTWSMGASLPSAIQIPASAAHGNALYVFAHGKAYRYDITTDSWSSFSGPPSGQGSAAEAVTAGDSIYLLGGNQGSIHQAYTTTEIYDVAADAWTQGPDLKTGRYQFGAAYVPTSGALLAVGGRDASASSLRSVEVLDVNPPALAGDVDQVSLSAGGVQTMTLNAGVANGGLPYLLLGSHSGTAPGVMVDGLVLPLNPDPYWYYTLSSPNQPPLAGSLGALDPAGKATATFTVPPGSNPAFGGILVHHAYAVIDTVTAPAPPFVSFVSQALAVTLVP